MSSLRYPFLRYPSQTNISTTNSQPTPIVLFKKVCTFFYFSASKVKSNRAPENLVSVPWITDDWNWSSVFFSPQLGEPQPSQPPHLRTSTFLLVPSPLCRRKIIFPSPSPRNRTLSPRISSISYWSTPHSMIRYEPAVPHRSLSWCVFISSSLKCILQSTSRVLRI